MTGSNHEKSPGTILLTGANGSLGSAIVSSIVSTPELAAHHGLYTVRDAEAAPALRSALGAAPRHCHDVKSLDLADLAAVRRTAAAINARVASGDIPRIRALILNAGYLEFTTQAWTDDGFDMSFASNYLGHWLLTLLLLQSMDAEAGRVVVIGSESHDPYNAKSKAAFSHDRWTLFMHDTTEHIAKGTWSCTSEDPTHHCGFRRYGASKFCQVMMIGELQRRLDADAALGNICVLGVDPGSMPGNLTRRGPWIIRVLLFQLIMPWMAPLLAWLRPNGPLRTVKRAAPDILAAAFASVPPLGERPKGLYLYGSRLEETTAEAKDLGKREVLWRDTVGYTQLQEGETALRNWQ
ncbi:short chain dehydrogenase [Hirsutella rhossiliensis]|uniref:3beta-hydroxysteroid 3-dehydrogenase n=1 Tax=Hirsutella rhossiliensis TaxID=111463 RepID=A0A9P8N6K4_9HYPO|nr:short chain dehydrogenase domain-containing protein [Hirsutella rhossiliensis]KAH0967875.1 short chain dehydrogenase domain-containing protein [Hirsutella rhossiliensis]